MARHPGKLPQSSHRSVTQLVTYLQVRPDYELLAQVRQGMQEGARIVVGLVAAIGIPPRYVYIENTESHSSLGSCMPPEAPDSWVELIQLEDLSRSTPRGTTRARRSGPSRGRKIAVRFMLLVLLPTALTTLYFGFLAADRYVSEATFVVRQPGMPNRLGTQVISTEESPKAASGEDSYAIHDYILSRDAMRLVIDKADLKGALREGGDDWFWRFPSFLASDSDEALFRRYQSLVSIDFESSTGLTVLRAQGFRPEAAQRMAQVLMQGAEDLLNRLNARSRRDALRIAQEEAEQTRAGATAADGRLTAFRNRIGIADPLAQAKQVLETISVLTMDKVATATQLDIALQAAPNSPQIAPLRSRVRALQVQIDEEKATLAGKDAKLTPYLEEYERLSLQREFAQKTYLAALAGLRSAEMDVRRQQSYLEPVVMPDRPDRAAYPWRKAWIASVFLCGMFVFLAALPTKVRPMRQFGREV